MILVDGELKILIMILIHGILINIQVFNQSYGVFYNYNFNGTTSDDWLISQCFELESNKTYTLGFKYRVIVAAIQKNECLYWN